MNAQDTDWQKLYEDYMYWAIQYDEADPPVFERAADVLLGWLQQHCTHPIRFYNYQLESITHLCRVLHSTNANGGNPPLEAFRHVCLSLLNACNEGRLPNTLVKEN